MIECNKNSDLQILRMNCAGSRVKIPRRTATVRSEFFLIATGYLGRQKKMMNFKPGYICKSGVRISTDSRKAQLIK